MIFRNLKVTGQKIGLSAALCHIHKTLANCGTSSGHVNGNKSNGRRFNFVLTIANVGDVEAVLCRKGEAVLLTRKFVALSDNEETQRVCKSNGIVTEVGNLFSFLLVYLCLTLFSIIDEKCNLDQFFVFM